MNTIADLRKQAGLTQKELAEKIYVAPITLSKWETGRAYPRIEYLPALAKQLHCSIKTLVFALIGEEADR